MIFLFNSISLAEDQPIDIWNIDKKKAEENKSLEENTIENNDNNTKLLESDIYKMQSEKRIMKLNLIKNYPHKS